MLDINLKPPSAVKAVPSGPSVSVILVRISKNCVPLSMTALKVSDDRTEVENSWNVALNFSRL
ncbi:hypothetical protein [Blautia sp. AF17-9LB]|uniref:hypothetical protein n=1 Tax=Blautia sp. AF17-9LB TaxID=2292959 RepID=UPI0011C36966|nr:hypothetical protein [Blautia sp. AF17-9LB]